MKSLLFSSSFNLLNWSKFGAKIITTFVLFLSSFILVALLIVAAFLAKVTLALSRFGGRLTDGILWCLCKFSSGVDWLGSCIFGCIDDIFESIK